MTEKNKYRIINIRRYIGNENPELGEDELRQILSEFSCPMNLDVLSDGFFYPHLL